MPGSIESNVKATFAKSFVQGDWKLFKSTADYYFRKSALLKRANIGVTGNNALLLRNIQKRLFLGIGAELLIKSYYLKSGFIINRIRNQNGCRHPFGSVPDTDLEEDNTFKFDTMISNLHLIHAFTNQDKIRDAFAILKVFRNKEGHVVTRKHAYDASVYRAIENGLRFFYDEGFSEHLTIRISMEPREKGQFIIR